MLTFPNCKINLGLFITNRRDDGYHDLETVFYPVMQLKDALEVVAAQADEPGISITGLPVSGNKENNLVWKAYQLMRERFNERVPDLDIFLHKTIPMGAGLGGGSADGAFMLRLVNDYCNLELSQDELATMALTLGSDCPFFIYNTPQFATGRGENMQPLRLDLSDFEIKIVTSDMHVSTKEAFSHIHPQPGTFDLRQLAIEDIKNWRYYLRNAFEEPVFSMYPKLRDIKQRLYDDGAVYAAMSGSGSAVYGIFKK